MELLGIIEPLETLEEKYNVYIITDSQYVSNAINKKWIELWIKRGWKTAGKKSIKNQDLWNRLIHLLNKHIIDIKWVKGHNGHPENEYCDKLAIEAKNSQNLVSDKGYHDS
jgi:ribonuclease HI